MGKSKVKPKSIEKLFTSVPKKEVKETPRRVRVPIASGMVTGNDSFYRL